MHSVYIFYCMLSHLLMSSQLVMHSPAYTVHRIMQLYAYQASNEECFKLTAHTDNSNSPFTHNCAIQRCCKWGLWSCGVLHCVVGLVYRTTARDYSVFRHQELSAPPSTSIFRCQELSAPLPTSIFRRQRCQPQHPPVSSDVRSSQPHYPPVSSNVRSCQPHYPQVTSDVRDVSPTNHNYLQMSEMSAPTATSIFRHQSCQPHYPQVPSDVRDVSPTTH